MTPDELIEEAAKAIYEARNGRGCKPFSRLPLSHRQPYIMDARAALAPAMRRLALDMRCVEDVSALECIAEQIERGE